MTTTLLVTGVADNVRAAVKDLRLPVEYYNEAERKTDATYRPINVYEQYIPADLFQSEVYFPCVIVELVELHDDLKEGSTATIGLSFGVYAKESDAWKDCFHLMETVRRQLLMWRVVNDRYRLTGEIIWQTAQNQPAPFFFTYAEATYQLYLPQGG